jgi:hypothetical protein
MTTTVLGKLTTMYGEMTEEQKMLNEEALNKACSPINYASIAKWLNPDVVLPENYNEIRFEQKKQRELQRKKARIFIDKMTNLLENLQFDEAFALYAKQIAIDEPNNEQYIAKNVLNEYLPQIFYHFANLYNKTKTANKTVIQRILQKMPEIIPSYAFDIVCQLQNIELALLFQKFDPNKYKLRIETQQIEKIVYAETDNRVIPLENDDEDLV